jgi:hypothetical protein
VDFSSKAGGKVSLLPAKFSSLLKENNRRNIGLTSQKPLSLKGPFSRLQISDLPPAEDKFKRLLKQEKKQNQ